MKLSAPERRNYILENLHDRWGWIDFEKGPDGYSYGAMLNSMAHKFGRDNVPTNTMTIMRDVNHLRDKHKASGPSEDEMSEAEWLLRPENFPEWRAKFFRVPETGEPFQTPPFQHAVFWVMYACTHKVPLPQWVIDLLDELDPVRPFPEDINELITGDKKVLLSLILLMAPRHGKTELAVHFVEHTYAVDQNKRIMFGNGTVKKSEGFIDNAIMSLLDGSTPSAKEFISMYGPFKADDRAWSKQGFTLAGRTIDNKAYSMQPFGIQGNIRSFDTDLTIGDDLQSLQRARSETITEEDYIWLTTDLFGRREYHTANVQLGSHVVSQTGDIFTRLENNLEQLNTGRQRTIMKKIPAHFYEKCDLENDPNHEKCVLWPEVRDYEYLEAQRALMDDDAMFEAVFNQVPRQADMTHFPADILRSDFWLPEVEPGLTIPPPTHDPGSLDRQRSWHEQHVMCCGRACIVGLGFDPAASEAKGASFTAWTVKGICTRCGRRYLIDYGQRRVSPEVHPEMIEEQLAQYDRIEVATIEINAYQKSLARDPRMDRLQSLYNFYVKEWTTDERKHHPDFGIPQMGRFVKSGMYSIPYQDLYDQEYAETFIKTLVRWPQRPNDLAMADWLNDIGLRELAESYQVDDQNPIEGWDKWATPNHDRMTYEVNMVTDFEPMREYP